MYGYFGGKKVVLGTEGKLPDSDLAKTQLGLFSEISQAMFSWVTSPT